MLKENAKRWISLVLSMIMLFSAVPVQAFAEESDTHDHTEEVAVVADTDVVLETEEQNSGSETQVSETVEAEKAEESAPTVVQEETQETEEPDAVTETSENTEATEVPEEIVDSDLPQRIQARIDRILDRFELSEGLSYEEIVNCAIDADEEAVRLTQEELPLLEQDVAMLTENEFNSLQRRELLADFLSVFEALYTASDIASKTVTVLDGQVSITDSEGTGNASGNMVTITAKGSVISKKTNTITVTNETENKAQLGFNYTASSTNSFTIAGNSVAANGSYSVLLDAKASVTIVMQSKSGFSDTTATLRLSDFDLVAAAEESDVTFAYDAAGGSVTVNGASVESGESQKISLTDGATIVATANGGYSFLGWIDGENKIISTETSYTIKPAEAMTITAVFAKDGGDAWFAVGAAAQKYESIGLMNLTKRYYYTVGHTYLYNNLNTAAEAAGESSTEKTFVLMNNATLPAGDYTIPAGVTLLIPFDSESTLYTTEAVSVDVGSYKTPVAYRTLTMASGAKLTVNGALSLSAQHTSTTSPNEHGSTPTGNMSFVKMEGSSNITVNNGGALYAYGYVTGSGTVTVNSGAKVYELFQLCDFRGGNASTSIENGVFPMSQYYVQNIEVPMTIYSGATEYAYTTMNLSSSDYAASVGFIAASDAMFNLTGGYVVKRYDGATDRLIVEGYGDLKLSPIRMTVGTLSINSEKYELPINSNITVSIQSGTITVNQDVALLPGSRVEIAQGASCVLGSGVNLYVYDADEWGTFCGSNRKKLIPLAYAPSRTYNRTEADLVDAKVTVNGTVDASAGYLYTTASGADIRGTGTIKMQPGTQAVTYQCPANGEYTEIPLTSAKLCNADGTYVETTAYPYGEYNCVNGVWSGKCLHRNTKTITGKVPTCTETGLTDGVQCTDCEEFVTEQEEIKALGHDMAVATCTKPSTCKRDGCGHTEGEALGHTPGAAATCATAQSCTVCGDVIVEALGHDMADATCTKPSTCKRDGCGHTEGEALGHTPGEAATCTTDQTCTVCGDVIVAALGHNMADATCEEPSTCKRDGCGHTEGEALGHTPGTAATCTTAQTCTVCGDVIVAALGHDMADATCEEPSTCKREGCGHTVGSALGHDLGPNATCTDAQTCLRCGKTLDAALGHDYQPTVTAPTCTEQGYTTHKCARCGDDYVTDYTDALGHDMADATCEKPATCQRENCGHTEGDALGHDMAPATCETPSTCRREDCGHTEGEKLGHDMAPATCEAPSTCRREDCGHTEGEKLGHDMAPATCEAPSTCRREDCGHTEGEKLGHDMAPATCEAPSTCRREDCGHTEGDKLGHDLIEEEEFPATCTEDGHTAGSYCSRCDYVTWDVIEAAGHDWQDVEAKKPTYTNVGWNAHKQCSVCKEKEGYEELPVLPAPEIDNYADFVENLSLLEELARQYALENPGKDPLNLVIKYIRTGVERYNSGSWGIMAGYEDTGFAKYVNDKVDEINSTAESEDQLLKVTGLKNLKEFTLSNGDRVDFGHMFGTMDITYHNNGSQNHADVAGWGGDITDLLSAADRHGVTGTLEDMVAEIEQNILCKSFPNESDTFSQEDMYGDLDGLYIMTVLSAKEYEAGTLTAIMEAYFTENLCMKQRADFFLRNRLGGATLRSEIRTAVYNAYTGNKVIATLEGTREFSSSDLTELRKACCYAFADYICKLAGDFVDVTENPYYNVFSNTEATLAPGITQQIKYATTADNKQMVYYIATADITRSDVQVFANYNNSDPASGWAMQRVLDQANAAQSKYGNPESEFYVPNYNVIAGINASGYNMSNGEPGGLLVMGGVEYKAIGANGFFGILKNGTAVIGTTEEYKTIYKDQVQEGVEAFGTTLIKDGKICVTATSEYYTSRASRTAVGITATGKVVMMVLDGRQEPFSCGGSMEEIAQIMLEAGCVQAVNLDGGGSTTYVAKQPGEEDLIVVNKPSDGYARSVSSTLIMVSTAPSSTAFDHAQVKAEHNYMTIGAQVQVNATGISATGDAAQIPEGAYWTVSDESKAVITENGVLSAKKLGTVTVKLMLDETEIGSAEVEIVNPDNVYFTKNSINAVYGQSVALPVKALYQGKEVAITTNDLIFSCNSAAGTVRDFNFIANADSELKNVKVMAVLACDEDVSASITVALYNQGEVSFDFDQATGGDRTMAWDRVVSNATTEDAITYEVIDPEKPMVANYSFALDMTQIPIPEQLSDLIYMLPGADAADASAWSFLLQLAERISELTEVKTSISFDPNVIVDYSKMKLVNDYFRLTKMDFDEQTNTLTLTLNWIKQTAAIDVETANPLCIVSGIKLTPKDDAAWDAQNTLTVENSGDISYKVYMRASGLYSFAQKEENQKLYGLLPYVNPNNASDKGGWFGSVYCTFRDSYTLVNEVKNGWVIENGGYAYYENGKMLTGIQLVDGLYYDFGDNGVNVGKQAYTGMVTVADKKYYASFGSLVSGWQTVGADYYYFSSNSYEACSGVCQIDGKTYTFDDNGILLRGAFVTTAKGTRYYWAGRHLVSRWIELEEGTYRADQNGYICYGNYPVILAGRERCTWWEFDEATGLLIGICDGFIQREGITYYCENGAVYYGAVETENGIIFCGTNGKVTINASCYISDSLETKAGLENGSYWCDKDGYILKTGFATISEKTYYFDNYVRAKGFTKIGEDYYFFNAGNGVMQRDVTLWVSGNNAYGVAAGYYTFQADGTMYVPDLNGIKKIVEKNGALYFTIDGVNQTNGLNELDGEYYYANTNGTLAVNTVVYISVFNDLIAPGTGYFAFDAEGKMVKTGFVTGGGNTYHYKELVRAKGFTKIGDDYYFFNASSGAMQCEKTLWVSGSNAYGVTAGYYTFQADGTMYVPNPNGPKAIVKKDGALYFTIDGVNQTNGLNELDGEYYYANTNGALAVNTVVYISVFNDLIAPGAGYFAFDAEGKMVKTGFVTGGGNTYYYDNLVRAKGFTKIGDDYYFFNASSGVMQRNKSLWVSGNNAYGIKGGTYYFGADGKMAQ